MSDDKPTLREEVYELDFTNQDGDTFLTGPFRMRAIEQDAEHAIAMEVANLTGGRPLHCFSEMVQINMHAMATIQVGVVEAPEWFPISVRELLKNPPEVNAHVAGRVREHTEAYFRGRGPATGLDALRRGVQGGLSVAARRR